jgi:hypothetical protein
MQLFQASGKARRVLSNGSNDTLVTHPIRLKASFLASQLDQVP